MGGLSFEHGDAWPALLALPLVWLGVFASLRAARRGVERWGAPLAERASVPGIRATLWTGMLGLGFLTWMNPQLGEETLQVERRGLDVVFCLDTSRSMLARDVAPDRLARAKRDVRSLLPGLVGGDRVALVAFAGEARLVVPPTHDLDAFSSLLETVDTDTVPRGGSDLAAPLRRALDLVDDGDQAATTVFVLLTDGEDLGGTGLAAAREVADRGIVVHTIGYGSVRGSKITLQESGSEAFLRDGEGDEVVSSLDADGLRAIAEASGGEFLRSDVVPLPLVELHDKRIRPMVQRAYDSGEDVVRKTRFQWLLLPLIGLLLLEVLTHGGSRR